MYHQEISGTPFAASIVINKENYGDPDAIRNPREGRSVYVETVARQAHPSLPPIKRKGVRLTLVESDGTEVSKSDLEREVCSKVTYNGRALTLKPSPDAAASGTERTDSLQDRLVEEQGTFSVVFDDNKRANEERGSAKRGSAKERFTPEHYPCLSAEAIAGLARYERICNAPTYVRTVAEKMRRARDFAYAADERRDAKKDDKKTAEAPHDGADR